MYTLKITARIKAIKILQGKARFSSCNRFITLQQSNRRTYNNNNNNITTAPSGNGNGGLPAALICANMERIMMTQIHCQPSSEK